MFILRYLCDWEFWKYSWMCLELVLCWNGHTEINCIIIIIIINGPLISLYISAYHVSVHKTCGKDCSRLCMQVYFEYFIVSMGIFPQEFQVALSKFLHCFVLSTFIYNHLCVLICFLENLNASSHLCFQKKILQGNPAAAVALPSLNKFLAINVKTL